MPEHEPIVREARASDIPAVAAYLAPRMASDRGEQLFRRLLEYRWLVRKPNLGILIEHGGSVVGFIGAIYAQRHVRGQERLFCNINSWCVDERFRKLSLDMLNQLLERQDCTFTCFSPSRRVVELLQFFGFQLLDSAKVLFAPTSGLAALLRGSRARIFWGDDLAGRLSEDERRILRDHQLYRCGHFLLERLGERSFFVTIRRGRGVRAFADVLYASDASVLADCIAHAYVPIARTHGTLLTAIDRRLLPRRPMGSFVYRGSRPLMFRSDALGAQDIDTLYSELVPMYG